MKRLRQLIELDPTLPWTEVLVTSYPQAMDAVNPNDDLNREVALFVRSAPSDTLY
jgi:rRNA-processing protein EBP2